MLLLVCLLLSLEDLLDRGQPLLQLLSAAELLALARRQELDIRTLDDRGELLGLALEGLGRRHEAGERRGQRVARDRARAGEQRGAMSATHDALDVRARQVALVRDLGGQVG